MSADEETSADDGALDGADVDDAGLESLLAYLHRTRAFDFSGYKRGSLARRVLRRMQQVDVPSYVAYQDYLEVHPDEFPQLFNVLLINVTSFFRDDGAWRALADRLTSIVLPGADTPIRVWSAGCSSGEEPYTLAMILCEALGQDEFTRRVKIYATDVDEDALAQARLATYATKSVESLPPALVERYFTHHGSQLTFQKEIRRAVIFGRHDLVQDAPIPRVDVLSCRNTLMYFNAETQARILQRLHFALNPNGLLLLGKAEMLLTHPELFVPLDLKVRLFTRSKNGRRRERSYVEAAKMAALQPIDPEDARVRMQLAAFTAGSVAQVAIDGAGRLAVANLRATQMFAITASDLGRPFSDLELSYRPAELRSCLDRVKVERRPMHLREVERSLPSGEKTFLDIEIVPLSDASGVFLGAQVGFTDVTHTMRLQTELHRANVELEAAHAELQSASEELETTNEELQSTVEELETTNEELQSTNEELETMNEELQSTNEELQTINEELRQSGRELNHINDFYGAVLGSLRSGVAVLDRDFHVQTWNRRMEDLWGVRPEEVDGKHFANLDIGLPVDDILAALRSAVSSGTDSERVLTCTNRRGRTISCKVTILPLATETHKGVIVLVEEPS